MTVSCTREETPRAADTVLSIGDSSASSASPSPPDMVLNLLDEISAGTTRSELAARFGAGNVIDTTIYLAEGETRPGSIVFPGDSSRRLEIAWGDSATRSRPATIHLNGTASVWKLSHNVTLGQSLSELEVMNGRPFSITGFGWDYGGTITDWKGGRLSDLRTGTPRVFLRLSPRDPAPPEVSGDRELSSDHPVLKRLDPIVDKVVLSFEQLTT